MESVLDAARAYRDAGISVIPIRPDGSKAPALRTWKEYQSRLATDAELNAWFADSRCGVAIICGAVSGGLEVIDCDTAEAFDKWAAAVEAKAPGLLAQLPHIRTPSGGMHVYYRTSYLAGNEKLAEMNPEEAARVRGTAGKRTLIETRGEGGYVLAPGSPPACHPTGLVYRHEKGPSITATPKLEDPQ